VLEISQEAPMLFFHVNEVGPKRICLVLLGALLALACARPGMEAGAPADLAKAAAEPLANPPMGPFGYAMLASEDGERLDIDDFVAYDECADCHERQWEEMQGSMHSVAHTDPIYRATAELARAEAGPEMYAYCSSCHSPQGVSSGLIPDTPESELPEIAKAGILCDVCHQISSLTGSTGPWGEPGNASFVLSPDEDRKFGPPVGNDDDADHEVETRDFLARSEFCAACHTIIHPLNGLRIEHTYAEWKGSVYAEKGIECQDCHMRSVEDAVKAAETLVPVKVLGKSEPESGEREIFPHLFVGGNANADLLGGSREHAAMGEERLKSAARLVIEAPSGGVAGDTLRFDVVVHNVAAGHNLPTSLTELREMWVELEVRSMAGAVLFHSGRLEANGDIPDGAMRFGALAGDEQGRVTYKPWEVTQFLFKRLIPPKGAERDRFEVSLPEDLSGELRIEAKLWYRSAPPKVVASLLGDEAFELKRVEMASAEVGLAVH
jgi:hypothetical protein